MSEEDVAVWRYERASATLTESSDKGAREKAWNQASLESCRKALERLVQEKAPSMPGSARNVTES